MLLSSEAPDERCSRLAAITLALVLCVGALAARAADPGAPASSEDVERTSAESPSGEATAEPAAQGETTQAAPPSDVEVIRIMGKAFSGIETEVPSSVTQFNPADLAALGAQDVSDVARFTPSLEINTVSATSPTFFIRGVGLNDFNANAAGAVAIYRDGVPINSPAIQLGGLFDVENVEVLRGPQGWGDDRNASGGAIKTYTRKPDGSLGAYLNADYGNYNWKDFQGAVSAPLMEEVLSSRVAFRFTERDPFYGNRCGNQNDRGPIPNPSPPPARLRGLQVCGENSTLLDSTDVLIPPGLPTEVNDVKNWAARAQLRFQPPGTEMDWLLNVHGGRLDHLSPLGQVIGTGTGAGVTESGYIDPKVKQRFDMNFAAILPTLPTNLPQRGIVATNLARQQTLEEVVRDIELAKPFQNDYDLDGKEKQDALGGFLRGDFALGPVRVSTITGTEWYDRSRLVDFDFSSNPAIHIDQKDDSQQWSENLGFEWEPGEIPLRLRWGGYYLTEDLNATGIFTLSPDGQVTSVIDQSYEQGDDSFGIYGNFFWDFLEDFTLEGGVRFNWERKTFELDVDSTVFFPDAPPFPVEGEPTSDEQTWSAPTGGLSLTYRFTEDLSAYWKYTRGWKAGHWNANVIEQRLQGTVLRATPSAADPETIDAFETGLRGTWLEGRLALGASLFYYQYQDYQVFVIENQVGSPPQVQVINANNARVWGAEADLRAEPLVGWAPEPLEGLVVSARFGWLESEFLDFTDTRFNQVPAQPPFLEAVVVDYSGNRLPNTPRFKLSTTVEYTFDLGRFGTLIPRYDFTWTDDIFFDPTEGVGANRFFDQGTLPEYSLGQRAYGLHDARLTYRPPMGSVEIAGWVRNLTNEIYKSYTADVTVAAGSILNFIGEPRTYGLSLSVSF